MMNQPIGRNDPCPCGSGLKYKKCCMRDADAASLDDDLTSELLATAYKKLSERKWEEALSLFEKALPSSKAPHTIFEAIAACYDGMDDCWRASAAYERALETCPKTRRGVLTYRYAVSKARCKQWDEACEAFRAYQSLTPNDMSAMRVDVLLQTIQQIQEGSLDENVFEANIQMRRALSAMEEERFSDAAKRLQRASALEPQNAAIYFNLAIAYTFMKEENKALETFQRCVELNPAAAEAFYNMGQIYLLSKKDFSMALSCFSRAASVRPDYIGAHHQKGKAYELLGYPEKALECWQKTIELDPENKMARENIKRVSHLMDKAQKAKASEKENT
ncbi:MAG: tetratricopeptide repeat protein [Desulfomonilaceae bacterium]